MSSEHIKKLMLKLDEMTSSGAVASVAMPIGKTQKRIEEVDSPSNFGKWANKELAGKKESIEETELNVGIEAHGVRGMKNKPWRKTFKSQEAFERWLDANQDDVEVHGTREVNTNDMFKTRKMSESSHDKFNKGDKVKVAHNGKTVTGTIVRYDAGGPETAFYVVDIGEPESKKVSVHNVKSVNESKIKQDVAEGSSDGKKFKFDKTYCSQCGQKFGPGNSGYSSCKEHSSKKSSSDREHDKKQEVSEDEMEESALQAYLGKKKYGEEGMKALQQAGREGASKEKMAKLRAKHDRMDEEQDVETTEGKTGPGLWANILAKRERIKSGSGERMRKPGSKGAPSQKNLLAARRGSKD